MLNAKVPALSSFILLACATVHASPIVSLVGGIHAPGLARPPSSTGVASSTGGILPIPGVLGSISVVPPPVATESIESSDEYNDVSNSLDVGMFGSTSTSTSHSAGTPDGSGNSRTGTGGAVASSLDDVGGVIGGFRGFLGGLGAGVISGERASRRSDEDSSHTPVTGDELVLPEVHPVAGFDSPESCASVAGGNRFAVFDGKCYVLEPCAVEAAEGDQGFAVSGAECYVVHTEAM